MRVHICAVGRMRAGPERSLLDDYLTRFERSGRGLGLGPVREHEVVARGGMAGEAQALGRLLPKGAVICALDERGKQLTSPDFARLLERWRDEGRADAAFVIGGADGLDAALCQRADFRLSLGAMVWPHMLVRVMLGEQLYRAATILAGNPYHRE